MKTTCWILLVLAILLAGCAGKTTPLAPSGPPAAGVHDIPETNVSAFDQNPMAEDVVYRGEALDDALACLPEQEAQEMPAHEVEGPTYTGDVEEEFFDEDLSFLEEEAEEPTVVVADPLAPWNRVMFQFNDRLYHWVLKPTSTGYKAVVPGPVRAGVQNFFTNLAAPIRMGSCILQGKGTEFQAEFARFAFNSTFGVFGLGNPSEDYPHLQQVHDEDMGQALAIHGVDNGFYIVWPVLGPSTARDSAGTLGDFFMNPISYLPLAASAGMTGEKKLNESSYRIGDYEDLKEAAIDPYEAVRDAYIQYREKKVAE